VKLKKVQVRMFRNFLDSTEVKIDNKVTCLVGKNESGKSAFLNALWRLKPARTNPTFSVPDHYPAWLEKRHRNEGVKQDDVTPVEVRLEWEGEGAKPAAAVIVVESKGKHLEGNPDKRYKRAIAGYFEKVRTKVPWQNLGKDFKDEQFRFQVLDEGDSKAKDWQDTLRQVLATYRV